jgi:DNA ligase-1
MRAAAECGAGILMKRLAELYQQLDETSRTNLKVSALVDYLRKAPPKDAIWAISFLIGRRPHRGVTTRKLRTWAAELAGIQDWLFDACYHTVGDLAETIALVLPKTSTASERPLHRWVETHLLPLRNLENERQRATIVDAWQKMDPAQRLVWNKLIMGGFRVGVSRRLVTRALAEYSGLPAAVIAHRLMGQWDPEPAALQRILSGDTRDSDISRPYPFYLAYALDGGLPDIGDCSEWQVEWKWDGIRAQVVKRCSQVFIWSRGQELVTEKFPEIGAAAAKLPDGTVVDGELLAWKDDRPLSFAALQRRIGRKRLTDTLLRTVPVVLIVYDLIENAGNDIRREALSRRVARLRGLMESHPSEHLLLSPRVASRSWEDYARLRAESRRRGVEGLMLKRRSSSYGVGRRRGDWWKWKVPPLTADAVLIYAQLGHGRRSGIYTDYTFGVWDGDRLVPFAKAYSGLSNAEIGEVDRFIRRHTLERYGPVRAVRPELVFEIAFDGIRPSGRHKSGVAVRFPRIARWRRDKSIRDADRLETVKAWLPRRREEREC